MAVKNHPVAKALADWRTRPLVLKCGGRDNADLAPQLKAIAFWP